MKLLSLGFGALLLFFGCGPSAQTKAKPLTFPGDSRPGAKWKTSREAPEVSRVECKAKALTRKVLDGYVRRGPGRLLESVEVSRYPESRDERFIGWKVEEVRDACLGRGLRVGDVVVSVNGSSLRTPSHIWKIWRQLSQAMELEVVVLREGGRKTLTVPVVPGQD